MRKLGIVENGMRQYSVEVGQHTLTIHRGNGGLFGENVGSIHVKLTKDKDDPNSDYFPGFYFDSMKSAIKFAQRD
jgi:hypothetical protein